MSHDPQSPSNAADFDEDEFESEDDTDEFECEAYWTGTDWHCPLAGSEECDWKCRDKPWEEDEP